MPAKKKTTKKKAAPKTRTIPIPKKPTASPVEDQTKVAMAYRNLFNRGEDAEIVLLDMMNKAGITRFNGCQDNDNRLRREGIQQFVFAILNKLGLTDEDIRQIIMNRIETRGKKYGR